MTIFYIEISFRVSGHESAEALEDHLDDVADCLAKLVDVIDPDLGASLADGTVDFALAVEAPDEPEALRKAMAAIRSAIHGGEGCTAGWEQHFTSLKQTIRQADLLDA